MSDAMALRGSSRQPAHLMTRRTALGAALVFASACCFTGGRAYAAVAPAQPQARAIDALLVDDSIEMPPAIAALVEASRRTCPVVGIRLDAAAQPPLNRLLGKSEGIVGISSGATLFCLERIAWDHGFRLTGRCERRTGGPSDDAWRQDVAAFLGGRRPDSSLLARAYRPSLADGTLHAWTMHKASSSRLPQDRDA